MLPDLSPHLHTEECNYLVELMHRCQSDQTMGKLFGACNYWDEAVWQCTKQERIWRRDNNPRYTRRRVELKRLPQEYYTPVLKKLQEEGLLQISGGSNGCKL